MASRKPLVWREVTQANTPSKWLRIIAATSFIGSTLERRTFVHHCLSRARTTLGCFRLRISRSCSRYCQARAVRLVVIWANRASSSPRCALESLARSVSSTQRRPFSVGSSFCSSRRVLLMASEACAITWNLSKVICALGKCSSTPAMNAGDMSILMDSICEGLP